MEVITRAEARDRGLKFFYTGRPCKHGHKAERYTSTNICVECSRTHRKAQVGKNLAEKRERYAATPKSEEFKEKARLRAKEWRLRNLERARAASRTYHRENREAINEYQRRWKTANQADQREKYNVRREIWREDPIFAMKERVSQLVRSSLKKKGFSKNSRTATVLGCSFADFASHLERQFLRGMTWENRALWHIDHIVPLATAVTEEDVLALNHFTNLRPLWGADNVKKGSKQTHLI